MITNIIGCYVHLTRDGRFQYNTDELLQEAPRISRDWKIFSDPKESADWIEFAEFIRKYSNASVD